MFLDTSALIGLFANELESQRFQNLFRMTMGEHLYISVVQMGEISDWCIRNGHDISELINALKKLVNVLPINEIICLKASHLKNEMRQKGIEKFGLMDGIVLASAQTINQKLLTTDTDFRISENAIVLTEHVSPESLTLLSLIRKTSFPQLT